MKLTVDREADALYLNLADAPACDSEEVAPGIVVDYDAQRRVVGIEMLNLSFRAPTADTRRFMFETVEAVTALPAVVGEDPVKYQPGS